MGGPDDNLVLPGLLQQVAETIGIAVALRLAHAYGGREIYIPQSIDPDHPIAEAVGYEGALALMHMLGHGRALIPMGPSSHVEKVAARIAELDRAGWSEAEIAAEVGVHGRTVRRHRAKLRGDDRQFDLFAPAAEDAA